MKPCSGHKHLHGIQLSQAWRELFTQITAKERKTMNVSLKAGRCLHYKQFPVHSTASNIRGSYVRAHTTGCTAPGAQQARVRWQRQGEPGRASDWCAWQQSSPGTVQLFPATLIYISTPFPSQCPCLANRTPSPRGSNGEEDGCMDGGKVCQGEPQRHFPDGCAVRRSRGWRPNYLVTVAKQTFPGCQ